MGATQLWHVTVTVSGQSLPPAQVRQALIRLGAEHGFLHSMRYAGDRAEITYWDEAEEILHAALLAMDVWDQHRESADLPRWRVLGLEVLEQGMYVALTTEGHRSAGGPGLGSGTPRPVPF